MRLPQRASLAASSSRQAIQEARNIHSERSTEPVRLQPVCVRGHLLMHSSYQDISWRLSALLTLTRAFHRAHQVTTCACVVTC